VPEYAFISIGSNIEPEYYLPLAIAELQCIGTLLRTSAVYQNPAIAKDPQSDYLNAAVLVETRLQPLEIRSRLREIETRLDRVRSADKYAPRTIDLDLCLYGDIQMETPELTLPDPDILERPHLALTLAELDPQKKFPGSDRSLKEIADNLIQEAELTLRPDLSLANLGSDTMEGADD
jgi:2-amino-4-hydroxy-6-hydroxymethyldihydropteridine diphosphokinase